MRVQSTIVGIVMGVVSATPAFAQAAPANVRQMALCVYNNVLRLEGSDGMVVTQERLRTGIGYPEGQRVRRATELLFGLQENAPGVDISIRSLHGEDEGAILVHIKSERHEYYGNPLGTAYAIINPDGTLEDFDGNPVQGLVTTGQGISIDNFDLVGATSDCIREHLPSTP